MKKIIKCPDNWKPMCTCSSQELEPNENCYYHGYPDNRFCPYCGKFRWNRKCTHCGCEYGILENNRIVNKEA